MTSKFLHIFIAYFIIVSVWGSALNVSKEMEWKLSNIVPDVIDIAPKDTLQVTYSSGVKANFGNELTPIQVKDIPQISWEAETNALYTVILTDPDAPNKQNPTFGEVRHWLVVNIQGNNISSGTNLYEYIGSGPPAGSGLHRYIFLVFKQRARILTQDIKVTTNRSREGRLSTKARDLITQFNLENIPVAGNFYQAQYDDYVPILHQQLGGAPPKAN